MTSLVTIRNYVWGGYVKSIEERKNTMNEIKDILSIDQLIEMINKLSPKEKIAIVSLGVFAYLAKYSIDNKILISLHIGKGDMVVDFSTQSLVTV